MIILLGEKTPISEISSWKKTEQNIQDLFFYAY